MVKQEKTKLPNSWKWVKLGEICDLSSLKHTPDKEEILFYIGLEHIEKNTGRLLGHVGKEKIDTVKNKFEKGDLLYGKLRPYLNKVYLANQSGVCSTDILVFKLLDTCYGQYLYYLMLSRAFVNEMSNNTSGVNLPRVSTKFILNYPIALPPISIQQAIVSKIEELFSELDKGIENLRIAQQQLKTYRQAVLKWAFEGKFTNTKIKDGELPKGWSWVKIDELSDKIFDGPFGSNLKSIDYVEKGVRVIRLENIGVLEFKDEYKTYITNEKYSSIHKHTVNGGDIIFSSFIIGEIRVVVLPKFIKKAVNKADCFCIRVNSSQLSNTYLAYFLSTKNIYNQLAKDVHGATRPRINTTQLKSCLIPYCNLEEQSMIVKEIECRLTVANKMEESITQSLQQAEALRQSILKQAFEGKLI